MLVTSTSLGTAAQVNNFDVARATTVNKVVQSAHNYANNFDYTWTIYQAGASQMRLRININTEANYDFLYLMDGSNNVVKTYTGNLGYIWTDWVNDDTVKLQDLGFATCQTVTSVDGVVKHNRHVGHRLVLSFPRQFAPNYLDVAWCLDTEPHCIAFDLQDGDFDIITNQNFRLLLP